MFHPLSLFLGLRYAGARSQKFFVSFITWVSLLGVAVGVAALIVILSVMNGFEAELRSRLLSLSSPVRVEMAGGDAAALDALRPALADVAGVTAVTHFAELQVLAVRQPEMLPVVLRGVDAQAFDAMRALLFDEAVGADVPGEGLVLGDLVAAQLGVNVGDTITLLVPDVREGGLPAARLREFTVTGRFEAGLQEHDGTLAYATLATMQALGATQSGSSGLAVDVATVLDAPQIAARIRDALDDKGAQGVTVHDWTQDHASYFRAIRIEKTMMALILLLVVAVAAFNIVAMLVMVVSDKRTDIAILRTQGAAPRQVAGAFITQGLVIGWTGVAGGVALGVLLARNVSAVLDFLDRHFGVRIFDADVFYITRVPSELHHNDVLLIAAAALAVTALATVYPALRAAAVPPAEALRYE
ncbi:MAG: lipoprotein-releasing ABC transporter permease subunit [Nevskiaceae bacterium]|jgi:lipoprotein-releasing system permease protein|nr:lipoprotein-releasing ABC transporter permease subunit [Nevskiaceae bacterium]